MKEMAKEMFVEYVAYPTKVAALHARCQAMIAPSYGANVVTFSICIVF